MVKASSDSAPWEEQGMIAQRKDARLEATQQHPRPSWPANTSADITSLRPGFRDHGILIFSIFGNIFLVSVIENHLDRLGLGTLLLKDGVLLLLRIGEIRSSGKLASFPQLLTLLL